MFVPDLCQAENGESSAWVSAGAYQRNNPTVKSLVCNFSSKLKGEKKTKKKKSQVSRAGLCAAFRVCARLRDGDESIRRSSACHTCRVRGGARTKAPRLLLPQRCPFGRWLRAGRCAGITAQRLHSSRVYLLPKGKRRNDGKEMSWHGLNL